MIIEVHFYAQLKDFFGDAMTIDLPEPATVQSLLDELAQRNALAADWLKVSRAANDDAFLNADAKLAAGSRCYILPPSSGG